MYIAPKAHRRNNKKTYNNPDNRKVFFLRFDPSKLFVAFTFIAIQKRFFFFDGHRVMSYFIYVYDRTK